MKDEDIDYSDIPPLGDEFFTKPAKGRAMSDEDTPKPAQETRTGADLIAALQASPYRDTDIGAVSDDTRDPIGAMMEAPGDRLFSAVTAWLWESADPTQLADCGAVRLLIDGLTKRPDAGSDAVRRAIAECRFYLEQPWT
jgi:hypothetical protein